MSDDTEVIATVVAKELLLRSPDRERRVWSMLQPADREWYLIVARPIADEIAHLVGLRELREVAEHAREVDRLLTHYCAGIVGHLMDDDDNAGERLRRALAALDASDRS